MRDIGKNIRTIREQKNLTQDQLAEQLFVTRQTVSNYETGRSRPDIDMLLRISETLDADIHILLYGPQTDPAGRKRRIQFGIWIGILCLLTILCLYLERYANDLKYTTFSPSLLFWVHILVKPGILILWGFSALQGISLSTNLVPLRNRCAKWVRLGICMVGIIYLIIMFPYLIQWYSVPVIWTKTAFFILGALPNQPDGGYLMIAFLLGAALWLFRPTNPTKEP